MANLYNKAGLINIPVGYSDGFLYNIKPTDNTLGFKFDRPSSATRVNEKGLIEQVGYFGPELVQNGDFSELGPELVVNGDFATDSDWTKGTGWSISGGKANCDGSQTSQTTLESIPNLALGVGHLFKITFDISNYSSGQIDLITLVGTGGPEITNINANGSYTAYSFGESTGNSRIQIIANSDFVGSIDNVSVKQVDPNDYWYASAPWSITNQGAFYDDTSGNRLDQSNLNLVQNKLYKLTFDIENTTGNESFIWIGNSGGAVPYVGTWYQSYSTGSNTVYFTMPSNQTSLAFYGSQTGGPFYINNISVTEVLGDKPRIDYTDSLTSPSFLLEPQSTNVLENSEITSTWTYTEFGSGSAGTITTGKTDMFGGTNAVQVDFPADAENVSLAFGQTTSSISSGSATTSVYIKLVESGSKTLQLRCSTGVISNVLVDTTDFVRYEATGTKSSGESFQVKLRPSSGTSSGGFSIIICQPQEEALSYSTSYIPTAGSTATRAAETCNGAGNASTFNSTEGVLYAEIAALANDGTFRTISVSDGTTSNNIRINYTSTSNEVAARVTASTGRQADFTNSITNINDFVKLAIHYKNNDCAFWVNGTKVGTDTSATMPSGLDTLNMNGGSGSPFYGNVKSVIAFKEALTDDELQQLTGPDYNSFAALAAAYNYTVI